MGKEQDFSILKNLRYYFDQEWRHLVEEAFQMLTRKGVYPYSYLNSFKRFDETSLDKINILPFYCNRTFQSLIV